MLGLPVGFNQSLRKACPVSMAQGAIVRVGHTGLVDNLVILRGVASRIDDALMTSSVYGRIQLAALKVVTREYEHPVAI